MRKTVSWFAAMVCVAGLTGADARGADRGSTTQPGQAAKPLAVATFNINYANADLRAIVTVIAKADADIVALQEVNEQAARQLRVDLARQYPHMKFQFAPAAGGFGFLSKLPLLAVRYNKPIGGYFGWYVTEIAHAGRQIVLFNTHLMPTLPRKGMGLTEFMSLWQQTEQIRSREIAAIIAQLPKQKPVIVLGDFNSLPAMTAPCRLKACGLVDSFAAVHKDADSHPTWHWKLGNGEWKLRLDYIYHSTGLATESSRIISTDASDHSLIVSRVSYKALASTAPATAPARAPQAVTLR